MAVFSCVLLHNTSPIFMLFLNPALHVLYVLEQNYIGICHKKLCLIKVTLLPSNLKRKSTVRAATAAFFQKLFNRTWVWGFSLAFDVRRWNFKLDTYSNIEMANFDSWPLFISSHKL